MKTMTQSGRSLVSSVMSCLVALATLTCFTQSAFAAAGGTPQASLTVGCGTVSTCNATNTDWTLDKKGDSDSNSAAWTVTATRGSESNRILTFNGSLTVTNTGTANATIGSILVNLQHKVGKNWITASSDVANATSGDDATTAKICSGASSEGSSLFSENSASGKLEFTDASNNTVFSLVPQPVIPPAGSITLNYSANFDATILASMGIVLSSGDSVRLEAIVSFGNSGSRGGSGASCANLDINGNGSIGTDEANVRSVPCRTTLVIPPLERSNATVGLTDDPDHITTTGTVGFSNFYTDIGGGTAECVNNFGTPFLRI